MSGQLTIGGVPAGALVAARAAKQVFPGDLHKQAYAVAIAGAETGGTYNPGAHCLNCFPGIREDSRGLWQINVDAHPQYAHVNLYDPVTNARAMAAISNGGTNWRPWSTYTSGSFTAHLPTAFHAVQAVNGTDAAYQAPGFWQGYWNGVQQEAGAVGGAAKATAHAAMAVPDFLGRLADVHTWIRVLYVLGGAAAIVAGALILDRELVAGAIKSVAGGAAANAAVAAV